VTARRRSAESREAPAPSGPDPPAQARTRWRFHPGARRVTTAAAIALLSLTFATAARLKLPPHGDRSVHDLAGVLSPGSVEVLEHRHAELYQKTGVALVLITVKSLEDETLPDFAVRVGSEWGAGKKGQDRGIVVAVTTDEPHIFVATGYGVEGFLTDGRVGAILDQYVVGPLKARQFDAALLQASEHLVAACATEFGVTIGGIEPGQAPPPGAQVRIPPIVSLLFLIALFVVFRVVIGLSRGGRYRGVWYGGGFGGFGGGGFGGGGGGFGGFGGGGFGGGGAGR
jgi:uncharacterized protein